MSTEIITDAEVAMRKRIENLEGDFNTVRTGRANANVLDRIMVDYYGAPTPISQLAGIKSPEANLLVIEPWDKSVLSGIEKAIHSSDLGVTPSNDGTVIRLPFPLPTEERRRELVKQCHKYTEETRVTVRNVRRDANSRLDRMKKDGEISEDDLHRGESEIQKLTDRFIKEIDDRLAAKEAEVMEI
jgi:ribosome recycling factor